MRLLLALLLIAMGPACSRDTPTGTPVDGDAPDAAVATPPATASPATPAPDAPDAPTRIEDLVRFDDTLAAVQARLGAGEVVAAMLPCAEGETTAGWTLFPADPSRRLSVYLDEAGVHPLMLLAGQEAVAWTRADGVRIGLSSQALAQLNGGPYGFMGFDWDYGGVVTDWRGGRLAPDGASAGPVTLCPRAAGLGEEPADYPVGDSEFGSDDARLLVNPAWVCEFGVNIDPPVDEATPATGAPGG